MISVLHDPSLEYPDDSEAFAPSEAYPERPFPPVASRRNRVYAALRDLFHQSGLDSSRYGTKQWNPLGEWVPRGASVFVLCNFVYHRKPQESWQDFYSKCSHGSVLRALADYLLIAVGPEGRVGFGNASLQSCVWERVLEETGAATVERFYRSVRAPVSARDLRLWVAERSCMDLAHQRARCSSSATSAASIGPT